MFFSPAWPTEDSIIPWRLFVILSAAMWSVMALERVNAARAAAQGIALGFDGQRAADGAAFKKTLRHAFPEGS